MRVCSVYSCCTERHLRRMYKYVGHCMQDAKQLWERSLNPDATGSRRVFGRQQIYKSKPTAITVLGERGRGSQILRARVYRRFRANVREIQEKLFSTLPIQTPPLTRVPNSEGAVLAAKGQQGPGLSQLKKKRRCNPHDWDVVVWACKFTFCTYADRTSLHRAATAALSEKVPATFSPRAAAAIATQVQWIIVLVHVSAVRYQSTCSFRSCCQVQRVF